MKKFNLLFTALLFICAQQLSAQCSTCTPVFNTCPPAGGICNHLDTAYANHPYDKVLNFFMPKSLSDPSILAQCQCNHVDLREIRVTGVSGLPTGVTYSLSQGGTYNVQGGDSLGCAHFCGTPLVAGLYPVTVYLMADVTAYGTPIGTVTQNNNPQSYKDTLYVLPDTIAGVSSFTYGNNGFTACDSITVNLNARLVAPSPNLTRYFWNIAGQNSELKTPGTFTYLNVSQTQPDTFPITLTTVYYNYLVKKFHISHVSGGYCGDIEEVTCSCLTGADSPDPYVKIGALGFNNDGSAGSNTCNNINFDNLNLPIAVGTDSLGFEIWDLDTRTPIIGTQDDLLGTYKVAVSLGQKNFFNGNVDGYIEFDTIAGTTITETLLVIVNPFPLEPVITASQDTFCSTDSTRLTVGGGYPDHSFAWYRDTVYLATINDSAFYTTDPGKYKVTVTNNATGCSNVSTWKTIAKVASPNASINILFNGTSAFVTPFPSSGFAVDWYYNGNLVVGQHGKFLAYLGNGVYTAEVYNNTFPSCRTIAHPDTVNVSGVEEIGNSVYDLAVFPNPNNGKFTLKFTAEETQNIAIRVENMLGQIVSDKKLENFNGEFTQELDLSTFSKGVYFVSIETAKGRLNKKVVVQ